jgi:type IV fimbrial biogenesis protein FimT
MENRNILGFTLIELLITVAVLTLLLTMAVPRIGSISANNRLSAEINQLTGELAYARTEAIKRGTAVTVTAANASNWAEGWTITAGGTTLRNIQAFGGKSKLTSSSGSLQFTDQGRLNDSSMAFKLCDNRSGDYGKKLTITGPGQTYLETNITCP